MRAIVTGARGYVGAVVTAKLLEAGHDVVAVDLPADRRRGRNEIETLTTRGDRSGRLFALEWNLIQGFPPVALDKFAGIDAVFHFAAATGSLDRPLPELRAANGGMALTLFRQAQRTGVAAFLHPTTSLALAMSSPYSDTKEESRRALEEHPDAWDLLISARFFNQTGAFRGMTENRRREVHVVPLLVRAALEDRTFTVLGGDWPTRDGTPGRDYTSVSDSADFMVRLAEAKTRLAQVHSWAERGFLDGVVLRHGVVNIGHGRFTTTRELIGIFERETGRTLRWDVGARRRYDCARICSEDKDAGGSDLLRWMACTGREPQSVEEAVASECATLFKLHKDGLWPDPVNPWG